MPQCDVFKRRLGVAAHYARQAADLFAGDGVLLVRHGRRALLLFAEVLLRLANLGALQVADLDGELVERAADERKGGDVGSMAIALNDLRGYGRGLEAEALADSFFLLGLEMAEGTDGAGELADAHVFSGGMEAGQVALHLGVPVQQLESERGGLGVNAVSATDGRGVLEFDGSALEYGEHRYNSLANVPRRLFDLQGLAPCRRRRSTSGRSAAIGTLSSSPWDFAGFQLLRS